MECPLIIQQVGALEFFWIIALGRKKCTKLCSEVCWYIRQAKIIIKLISYTTCRYPLLF